MLCTQLIEQDFLNNITISMTLTASHEYDVQLKFYVVIA